MAWPIYQLSKSQRNDIFRAIEFWDVPIFDFEITIVADRGIAQSQTPMPVTVSSHPASGSILTIKPYAEPNAAGQVAIAYDRLIRVARSEAGEQVKKA